MFSFPNVTKAVITLAVVGGAWAVPSAAQDRGAMRLTDRGAERFPGVGRAATPAEVAAWDIDVRPDLKGLPKGSGSVADGQVLWEAKCASCHGVFGESNQVFTPLVGGTTAADVKSGRVARLTDPSYPGRTTMMKVPTVSTLWDYIQRAMPWTNPKTLTPNEVYAVTAFMLNLADVLPADFVLSDQNMPQVQAMMPNRLGMTVDHALWPQGTASVANTPGPARQARPASAKTPQPDVRNTACMQDCAKETTVASSLPAFARNAHGNLADQNRLVGAQRGVNTADAVTTGATPVVSASAAPALQTVASGSGPTGAAAQTLLNQHGCMGCHAVSTKVLGPSFKDVHAKHGTNVDMLAQKIKEGGVGVWGQIPMPAQALPAADAKLLAQWIAGGAKP
jgi:S-disulfanyl-L-cysteine oxidoreductase SoxD